MSNHAMAIVRYPACPDYGQAPTLFVIGFNNNYRKESCPQTE